MKFGRLFAVLGAVAFVILGGASVWMGALNQDEGWYLYAAQMVADGFLPYRDFFYTQGPLLPMVYAAFSWVWGAWGLLGGRILTLLVGTAGLVFAVALARRLAGEGRRTAAGLIAFLALGSNLYHVYYLTIPKTYALASLFVLAGYWLLALALEKRTALAFLAALSLAFASGTRISLGALLAVVGVGLLATRRWKALAWFCAGGALGLLLAYGPFVFDAKAFAGLMQAQRYHAARGGFDVVWLVGSLSRLVRWYLGVFVLLGLWAFGGRARPGEVGSRAKTLPAAALTARLALAGFLTVFGVQMLAPFPYEDYQVPVMGLLAVFVAVVTAQSAEREGRLFFAVLLALGLSWGSTFGSPLLEKWTTNGQDRFWSLKKQAYELPQLRDVARRIEQLDPGGKTLLTQDLYLAIETGRKVPRGLEMGPFAMLDDAAWRELLASAPCTVAALSGYSFAIEPPACVERSVAQQRAYQGLVKRSYRHVFTERLFGQNQTTLEVLKRK